MNSINSNTTGTHIGSVKTMNDKTSYDIVKTQYDKFLQQAETSEKQDSYNRYIIELTLLQNMREQAQKLNLKDKLDFVNTRIQEINKLLKEQKGVTLGSQWQ